MSCTSKTIVTSVQTSDYLSYYLTTNADTICRICLEKAARLVPIFEPTKPPHFSLLMMACASVQVAHDDDLPPNICTKCISRLNHAFQFKTQCEMADAKLRQAIENMLLIQAQEPEQEQEEQCNKQIETQALKEDAEMKMDELIIYNECLNSSEIKLEFATPRNGGTFNCAAENQLLSTVQSAGVGVDIQDVIILPLPLANETLPASNTASATKSKTQKNQKKPRAPVNKVHCCHMCEKVFRTKPSLVHHIRIHTGERPYVCHLCDKRFINGGHLHTHMRTHTGEKNHVCSACPKAFPTAQQLTKHTIAIHTAERPYACSLCPKRFASSSNLNTHIKVHTGEKNYYCEQCGKGFSTKGQLDQHMLVHTGEKAFMCEVCQKRFSQKAHLVRHFKLHQKESKQEELDLMKSGDQQ